MEARPRSARLVGTGRRAALLAGVVLASAAPTGCAFWTISDWSDDVGADANGPAVDSGDAAHDATADMQPPSMVDAASALAFDTFGREVTGGLGRAEVGGMWTTTGNTSSYVVRAGAAHFTATAGQSTEGYLFGVSVRDLDATASFSTNKAPDSNGIFGSIVARVTSKGDYFSLALRVSTGGVNIELKRRDGTSLANVPSGLSNAPGKIARLRLQLYGASPAHLRGRAWPDGTAEPTTWNVTADDSTPDLQVAGSIGFIAYVSAGSTAGTVVGSFDDLDVRAFTP